MAVVAVPLAVAGVPAGDLSEEAAAGEAVAGADVNLILPDHTISKFDHWLLTYFETATCNAVKIGNHHYGD